MRQKRNWSPSEIDYLTESWGRTSIDTISKNLGRSIDAVRNKSYRIGLGKFTLGGDYITVNTLFNTMFGRNIDSYYLTSWVKNRNFPVKSIKRSNKCKIKVVYLKDFWKWAHDNQELLDFSNFKKNSLGAEPDWVEKKRNQDAGRYLKVKWSKAEDEKLRFLVERQRYTYKEISDILNRSDGAIERRLVDLKIKSRPLKAPNHVKWTEHELNCVLNCIKTGGSYRQCSDLIGKSEKAVRGKMGVMFGTENLDKIRKILR